MWTDDEIFGGRARRWFCPPSFHCAFLISQLLELSNECSWIWI
jgi:hypothetical protein